MKTDAFTSVCYTNDSGDDLQPGVIYIEGLCKPGEKPVRPDWVMFVCPCGCRCQLDLPLNRDVAPNPDQDIWSVSQNPETEAITLHPSVNIRSGCKAHFWIRDGKVDWC